MEMTSAIHDAQNICWKLAAVLAGSASPELLDTYEPERRSTDQRNAQRSLDNAINHFAIGEVLLLRGGRHHEVVLDQPRDQFAVGLREPVVLRETRGILRAQRGVVAAAALRDIVE